MDADAPDPSSDLSERATLAWLLAKREAHGAGASELTTAHLLLGLLLEEESSGARVLTIHGVTVEAARAACAERSPAPSPAGTDGEPSGTPEPSEALERVLRHAAHEAEWDGKKVIATEHLLLGLLHDADAAAARLLTGSGIEPDEVRAAAAPRPRRRRTP